LIALDSQLVDPVRLLAALPDPVVVVDGDGRLRWANDAATEQLGWPREDWLGQLATQLVHPDDLASALVALTSVRGKAVGTPIELRVRTGSGAWQLVELRGRAALEQPGVDGIVLVLRDITQRRRWELAAGDDVLVRALVQYAPVIIFHLHPDGRIRTASPALVRTLGLDMELAEDQPFLDLVAPDDRGPVGDALAAACQEPVTRALEARLVRAGGDAVWHRLTVVGLVQDPVIAGVVVTAQDVTTLAEARRHLHHLATHDPLTGAANRAALMQYLAELLSGDRPFSVVFLDLDGFKEVNDRFGHQSGDLVLIELVRRLRDAVPSATMTARFGGDEFILVVPEAGSPDNTAQLVDRVVAAVGQPVALYGGDTVTVHASCGLAVRNGSTDPADLLAAADAAMYAKKGRGRHEPHRPNGRTRTPSA
jgi:diguanylate cyclase (GGDEF)-like protein/PAS domain S-box-containing protein